MKLWGGRFEEEMLEEVNQYTSSLSIDFRLLEADLEGSTAHAKMLGATGILSAQECETILSGLSFLQKEYRQLPVPEGSEDVHSVIEQWLTQKIGPVAGKLHTARSRNDQVATAVRIYLKKVLQELDQELFGLQRHLVDTAKLHQETLLPGLTHLQHAQPVSFAHHLLAYFWMFARDRERFQDTYKRTNHLPLGSAALAGTTLPIDRNFSAKELGFPQLTENSLDAVSDRDFAVEFLASSAILATHLSRIAEELVIWSTPEFGFVEMSDSVTTGSSLMPQKKNPDVAELLRSRTGRLNGALMGLLTVLKALPLSYNRDLQEDKFHLFQGVDAILASVKILHLLLKKSKWKSEKMREKIEGDQSNATDLADYLVKKGVPFRETHEISGKAVRLALQKGIGVEKLSLADLKSLHPSFEQDVYSALDPLQVMRARNSYGGTGTKAVALQIVAAEKFLEKKVYANEI